MSHALAIAGRELRSIFSTPVAYVLIAVYMLFAGFVFFASLGMFLVQQEQIQALGMMQLLEQWNMQSIVIAQSFSTYAIFLAFVVPLLAMRAFAEERATGSIELLLTSPVSSTEIVLGKFLAIAAVLALVTLLTALYPLLLFAYGDPEPWQTLAGLQTLLLYSLSLAALCCFISALTRSQIVAGLVGVAAALVLLLIPFAAESSQSGHEGGAALVRHQHALQAGLAGDVRSGTCYFGITIFASLAWRAHRLAALEVGRRWTLLAILGTILSVFGCWVVRRGLAGIVGCTSCGLGLLVYAGVRSGPAHGLVGPGARWRDVLVQTAILIGICGALAWLSMRHPLGLDRSQSHSLSQGTVDVLTAIPEKGLVEIYAFYTRGGERPRSRAGQVHT
jgi:ABC-2 type transport system permease protein